MTKVLKKEFQFPRWLINYELECLEWYVDETSERSKAFLRMYPDIKYYEVEIGELNTIESVQKMLLHFGCSWESSLIDTVGKPTNLKAKHKVAATTL